MSEEELLAFAEVAAESEAIEEEEQALIESIIEFGDTIVREVMVPRLDMVTVESSWRVSDVMEVIILNGFSRIPVIGASVDDIVGLAYAKDLMRAERDGTGDEPVGGHVRPARFVPESSGSSTLLPQMQAEQFHMAVVVDEYGGVAGLVTLEDLIEELLGEIVDEFDVEEPMAEPLGGGAYRVNARMPLDEVNDLLDADLPEGDWDTIGGLLFSWLGHMPANGESVDVGTHRLTAVDGCRVGASASSASTASRCRPTASTPRAHRSRSGEVRLRDLRRAPERRQVDAAEPDPRREGLHRLGQGADDPVPDPRRAEPRRGPGGPAQIVFVDTPGIHKPRTPLGDRLNATASSAVRDVDVVCLLVDATMPIGRGDRFIAEKVPKDAVLVVNKVDRASPEQVLGQLATASEFGFGSYFPDLGPHRGRRRRAGRAPGRAHAGGPAVLPRGHDVGSARRHLGRRAGARAAAGGHP